MNLKQVKLRRLSICPCGYSVLKDEIPVGTAYTIDLDSFAENFTYRCGGCRRVQGGLKVVMASQSERDGMAYLPYDLFSEAQ